MTEPTEHPEHPAFHALIATYARSLHRCFAAAILAGRTAENTLFFLFDRAEVTTAAGQIFERIASACPCGSPIETHDACCGAMDRELARTQLPEFAADLDKPREGADHFTLLLACAEGGIKGASVDLHELRERIGKRGRMPLAEVLAVLTTGKMPSLSEAPSEPKPRGLGGMVN
jgi:hypothetical protein